MFKIDLEPTSSKVDEADLPFAQTFDNNDGTYTSFYQASCPGDYKIHITTDSKPIKVRISICCIIILYFVSYCLRQQHNNKQQTTTNNNTTTTNNNTTKQQQQTTNNKQQQQQTTNNKQQTTTTTTGQSLSYESEASTQFETLACRSASKPRGGSGQA